MRLKDKDKAWLREEIKAAVWEALTVDLTWEKVKDEKTGKPLATKEVISEKVFLPTFFCQHLKFHEGSYRGNQETLDKVKNNANALGKKVEVMGQAFLAFQDPMIVLERFVGLLAKTGIMERLDEIATIEVVGSEVKKIAGERLNAGDNR